MGSGDLNKPLGFDGMALWTNLYLAPNNMGTWLFLIRLLLVVLPTPEMTHNQLKGNLIFHRLHFDGKTNAYYNNKNTILEKTSQGE